MNLTPIKQAEKPVDCRCCGSKLERARGYCESCHRSELDEAIDEAVSSALDDKTLNRAEAADELLDWAKDHRGELRAYQLELLEHIAHCMRTGAVFSRRAVS